MVAGEVTALLHAAHGGDAEAGSRLWELVYAQVLQIARKKMARERMGHTLQATAVANEAYMRLDASPSALTSFANGKEFFHAVSKAVLEVLIDYARKHGARKRGGGLVRHDASKVVMADDDASFTSAVADLDALRVALERMAAHPNHARKYELVMLRYFGGLGEEQVQEVLGVSRTTYHRDLRFARAWLRREMDDA